MRHTVDTTNTVLQSQFAEPRPSGNNGHAGLINYYANDPVNGLDAHFSTDGLMLPRPLAPLKESDKYSQFRWRGLLTDKAGCLAVEFGDVNGRSQLFGRKSVRIKVLSSVPAINQLQELLGRQPGNDAFKLETIPGAGEFRVPEWVDGFAEKTVRTADVANWVYAEHDQEPEDHVQCWLATPPTACEQMARRAQQIKQRHGQHLYNDGPLPAEAKDFVSAADGYSRQTAGLFNQLYTLIEQNNSSTVFSLDSVRAIRLYRTTWRNQQITARQPPGMPLHNVIQLQNLGILEADATTQDVHRVTGQFMAQIADLFLHLEEVRPREDESSRQRSRRLARWQLVRNEVAI